jgi:hypothetical protein
MQGEHAYRKSLFLSGLDALVTQCSRIILSHVTHKECGVRRPVLFESHTQAQTATADDDHESSPGSEMRAAAESFFWQNICSKRAN